MKKYFVIMTLIVISALFGCSSKKDNKSDITKWDCSVFCAKKSSTDNYVITYSKEKIRSQTGTITIQNRNDFDVIVHLLCDGAEEHVSDKIPAGGCFSFMNISDKVYSVGIHAYVEEKTEINVFAYDGECTEPYTP